MDFSPVARPQPLPSSFRRALPRHQDQMKTRCVALSSHKNSEVLITTAQLLQSLPRELLLSETPGQECSISRRKGRPTDVGPRLRSRDGWIILLVLLPELMATAFRFPPNRTPSSVEIPLDFHVKRSFKRLRNRGDVLQAHWAPHDLIPSPLREQFPHLPSFHLALVPSRHRKTTAAKHRELLPMLHETRIINPGYVEART